MSSHVMRVLHKKLQISEILGIHWGGGGRKGKTDSGTGKHKSVVLVFQGLLCSQLEGKYLCPKQIQCHR